MNSVINRTQVMEQIEVEKQKLLAGLVGLTSRLRVLFGAFFTLEKDDFTFAIGPAPTSERGTVKIWFHPCRPFRQNELEVLDFTWAKPRRQEEMGTFLPAVFDDSTRWQREIRPLVLRAGWEGTRIIRPTPKASPARTRNVPRRASQRPP